MSKKIFAIIIIVIVTGLGYFYYQSGSTPEEITEAEAKSCQVDSDCVVFGVDGDCNCGCFNKKYSNWQSGGDCFCAAPTSCKCINGKCEGVFGEDETADLDGQKIEVGNDNNFSVVLEANPTTGYQWELDFDSDYIQLVDKKYAIDWQGPDLPPPGTGGHETFNFLALKPGKTELVFSYLRSWEEEPPIEKKVYEIIIK